MKIFLRFLAAGVLAGWFASLSAQAQTTFTYSGQTPGSTTTPATGNFTLGFNGDGAAGYVSPTSGATTILAFNGPVGDDYTATDDLSGTFLFGGLSFGNANNVSVAAGAGTTLTQGAAAAIALNNTGSLNFGLNVNNGGFLSTFTTTATTGASAFTGVISGVGGLTKAGAGVLTLQGANTYTGATTISGGTLALSGGVNRLSTLTNVTINNVAGTAILDLGSTSQTIASLSSSSNSATANTVNVTTGQSLTINGTGGLNVGVDLGGTSSTTSKLTISGGGSLVVTNASANVVVGLAQANNSSNNTGTLDLTGLASVTLGNNTTAIGGLLVGYTQTASGSLLLSSTANTITASAIQVGNSSNSSAGPGTSQITLGTGTNVLDADTFDIAASNTKNITKDNATVAFVNPGTVGLGSVTIANKAGTGGAAINIGSRASATGGGSTGGNITGLLDLRGHTATINAGVMTIGQEFNNGGAGSSTGTLSFDTGTLTATTLNLGANQSSSGSTGAGTGTLNIGQSAASTGTVTVGTINLATKSAAGTGAAVGAINLVGGSLTVNTAFTLSAQSGTATSTGTTGGTVTITGGTVTSNVDILKGATAAGTATDTITLNGGTLDLKGHNIGSSTPIDNLNFQSGTLQNVAGINNGAGLTKTTGGTLTLAGTNTYTGATNVSTGTLLVNGSTAAGSTVAVNGGILGGTGTAAGAVTVNAGGTINPGPTGTAGSTAAVGMLSVGALILSSSTSGLAFDLNATTSYDKLISSGAVNLALGSFTATVGTGAFNSGDVLTLISGTSLTPFNAYAQGAVVASNGTVNFTADYTTTANAFDLDVVAVPEPSTWIGGLLGIGWMGFVLCRRRVGVLPRTA